MRKLVVSMRLFFGIGLISVSLAVVGFAAYFLFEVLSQPNVTLGDVVYLLIQIGVASLFGYASFRIVPGKVPAKIRGFKVGALGVMMVFMVVYLGHRMYLGQSVFSPTEAPTDALLKWKVQVPGVDTKHPGDEPPAIHLGGEIVVSGAWGIAS